MFYEEEEEPAEPNGTLIVDLLGIGRQIKAAKEERNHIEFGKLGEHLDALSISLAKLSQK